MESWIMNPMDLIWVVFLLMGIQPVISRRWLDYQRVRLMQRIEKQRGSRVITIIHRQEAMALLGFPIARFIDIEDSEAVLRAIRLTPSDLPLDLILHTPGGLVLASEQIARALCQHQAKVTVFVPHYAMSGGTMLALAADEIRMDEHAVLGPLDPQVGEYPAASILAVLESKPMAEIDDRTLILADLARKASAQVSRTVADLLVGNGYVPTAAAKLADALVGGQWTHDYPITVQEAQDLGLRVEAGLPEEMYSLMELFPQPSQRRPSVGYVPIPYSSPDATRRPVPSGGR
jgi:ClpP class serine protease